MPNLERLTLTMPVRDALERAAARALRESHATVELEHLLLELCRGENTDLAFLLRNEGLDPQPVLAGLEAAVARFRRGSPRIPELSGGLLETLSAAWVIASADQGRTELGSASIVCAAREVAALLASVPALSPVFTSRLAKNLPEWLGRGWETAKANPGVHDNVALSARLYHQPYRFDLRQAVRLLELMAPADTVPVGAGSDPTHEAVRLRSSLRSNFPPSDIESLDRPRPHEAPQPVLTVTVLGIAGAYGPLPPPLTARVIERERVKDHSARDFLNLFNHRLLTLMLRMERLFHPALQVTSAKDVATAETPASVPLLALLGVATLSPEQIETRLGGIATSLIGAAGLLNPKPLSAHALERLVGAHFDLPVRVVPLCGGWLNLADDQLARLGRFGQLGRSAVLGGRVWDQAAGIRIAIGPTDRATVLKFLPDGSKHAELAGLVTWALGDAFDVELCLMLRPQEVPPGSLAQPRPRLGWTSWLGQAPWQTPAQIRLRLNTRRAVQH